MLSGGGSGGALVSSGGALGAQSAEDPLMTDKQSLCIDILVGGYVNSFVDFFYLTHRAEEDSNTAAAAAAAGGSAGAPHPPPIPDSKLSLIQHHLTSAERAHRRGDSEQVYASYEALAHDFHAAQDYKTSIYFYEVSERADLIPRRAATAHRRGTASFAVQVCRCFNERSKLTDSRFVCTASVAVASFAAR